MIFGLGKILAEPDVNGVGMVVLDEPRLARKYLKKVSLPIELVLKIVVDGVVVVVVVVGGS